METNKAQELTEELTSNLKKTRPNLWGILILCCTSLVFLFAGIVLFWHPCLNIKQWTWQELIFAVFSISILAIVAYSTCQFLFKFVLERQQENKKWQTKVIDAYGKLLEEQFKKNEEKTEDMKKKEEELNKKKYDLEIAKLDYEIERLKYRKAHVEEE